MVVKKGTEHCWAKLPRELRRRIYHNLILQDKINRMVNCNRTCDLIMNFMTWNKTVEGTRFWSTLHTLFNSYPDVLTQAPQRIWDALDTTDVVIPDDIPDPLELYYIKHEKERANSPKSW